MENFKFILKCFVITIVLIFFMQIKIGQDTIEDKAMFVLQESVVAETLRDVADGAILFFNRGYRVVKTETKKLAGKVSGEDASK